MTINIRISIQGIGTGIVLPSGGSYKFIQHDDLAKDEKGQRIRAPEVYPLYLVEYTKLTEAWQWFWFRVGLVHPYTGYQHWDETRLTIPELDRLKQEWKSLTHAAKAFTNNFGTDNCHDYINGNDLPGLPEQGAITCCGNIVRVIGEPTHKGTPIETLDGTKPPPPIEKVNRITRPDLIFCATNVPGVKISGIEYPLIVDSGVNKGRVKVDPFPNLADIHTSLSDDSCVPLRTNGNKSDRTYTRDGVYYAVNYIKTSRLVPIEGNHVPIPYVR